MKASGWRMGWEIGTVVLLAMCLAAPVVVWTTCRHTSGIVAVVVGLVLYFYPSLGVVTYHCVRARELPRVVGGPAVRWHSRRV